MKRRRCRTRGGSRQLQNALRNAADSISHACCIVLGTADHPQLKCMYVAGGGGMERSGSGSAVSENHHRLTENHAVNEGTWSTTSHGPQLPHGQVPGDERRRIPLRSVFGLVLGHLCPFWPETSGIVISVSPYPRGNGRWNHRWRSGWHRWAVGRGRGDRRSGVPTVGVVTADSSMEQWKQSL